MKDSLLRAPLAFLFSDGVEEKLIKLHVVWILGTYLEKKNMETFN